MGDPNLPFSPEDMDDEGQETVTVVGAGGDDDAEDEAGPECLPCAGSASSPAPLAGAGGPPARKLASGQKHVYMFTSAATSDTGHLTNRVLIKVPRRALTGTGLSPWNDMDRTSDLMQDQIANGDRLPRVSTTNLAHHVHTLPTTLAFEFTLAEVKAYMDETGGVDAPRYTSVQVFHPRAVNLPLHKTFDLTAARSAVDVEGSSSDEDRFEMGDKRRRFGRLVYGVDKPDLAARAMLQAESAVVPTGKVMLLSAQIRSCDSSFPIALRLCVTGIEKTYFSGGEECCARIFGDKFAAANTDGCFRVTQHTCTDEELASFLHIDPDREIPATVDNGGNPLYKNKWSLSPLLNAYVELYVVPKLMAKKSIGRAAATKLLESEGIFVSNSEVTLSHAASHAGLTYIKRSLRRLRESMPILSVKNVVASITPDVEGGWQGFFVGLSTARRSFDMQKIYTVECDVLVTYLAPDRQYESLDAYAQLVAAQRLKEAPPPPAPSAPTYPAIEDVSPVTFDNPADAALARAAAAAAIKTSKTRKPLAIESNGNKSGKSRR
jgi:hypothetical protein